MIRLFLIVIYTVILSGCSLLSPVKTDTPDKYVLTGISSYPAKKHARPVTMLVMSPDTQQVYNTTQMAYSIKPFQVSYYSRNEWGETPSQMLQPLIVTTLQNSHYFHAIVTPPYLGHYDYSLYTNILLLQQDFTQRPAVARVALRAELTNMITNRVVATKVFSIDEPMWQHTPYQGVLASNRATVKLLSQLSEFCIHNIGRG